jgi:hypothetical protein
VLLGRKGYGGYYRRPTSRDDECGYMYMSSRSFNLSLLTVHCCKKIILIPTVSFMPILTSRNFRIVPSNDTPKYKWTIMGRCRSVCKASQSYITVSGKKLRLRSTGIRSLDLVGQGSSSPAHRVMAGSNSSCRRRPQPERILWRSAGGGCWTQSICISYYKANAIGEYERKRGSLIIRRRMLPLVRRLASHTILSCL